MFDKLAKLFIGDRPAGTSAKKKEEIFLIDFISKRSSGETIEKAIVNFPLDSLAIIINGEEKPFDAYYVRNEGLSSDELYFRIATPKYKFWILPKDLSRFMKIAEKKRAMQIENRKKQNKEFNANLNTPVNYDSITDEIYKCFITGKSGTNEICTPEKFEEIESQISAICKSKNGRYYKSKSKSAKYAIIFSPYSRLNSNIGRLREEGYKVTTLERALQHFGLYHLLDYELMVQKEKEAIDYLKSRYC
ncbi:hypothetical protein DEAC_c02350 [Desulfosporosinus acididurans]|uniref:Uncharacterized protein n=1 Tax=Desulfosporosinus acididurans TaxID=476652 RepID=A0A0J1FXT8_9FIRM|nr:hypothetical protein [Desulfosporosinus acididurans]KLU67828.1 hypothetical protein DEAC_c02350 [Desulfosporosinus acididurans]